VTTTSPLTPKHASTSSNGAHGRRAGGRQASPGLRPTTSPRRGLSLSCKRKAQGSLLEPLAGNVRGRTAHKQKAPPVTTLPVRPASPQGLECDNRRRLAHCSAAGTVFLCGESQFLGRSPTGPGNAITQEGPASISSIYRSSYRQGDCYNHTIRPVGRGQSNIEQEMTDLLATPAIGAPASKSCQCGGECGHSHYNRRCRWGGSGHPYAAQT
jgi:hypothetical protein